MPISNTAPMLAAVANGADYAYDRTDRSEPFCGRGMKRGETGRRPSPVAARRALRRVDNARYEADLADELLGPAPFDFMAEADAAAARDALRAELEQAEEDEFADWQAAGGCYCRRCMKGDFGGCIVAELRADAEVAVARALNGGSLAFEPCVEAAEYRCVTCGNAFDACWMCRCDMPLDDDDAASWLFDEGTGRITGEALDDASFAATAALAGMSEAFDPADVQWGFTVQSRPSSLPGGVLV